MPVNVWIKCVSSTVLKAGYACLVHSQCGFDWNSFIFPVNTVFLKILQAALHGARQIRSWLEYDIDFFLSLLLWALWLVVQEENSSRLVEDCGLSAEPLFGCHVFYVGCPAACAEWWKQLSHLLHTIFISLPTSGESHGPKGLWATPTDSYLFNRSNLSPTARDHQARSHFITQPRWL